MMDTEPGVAAVPCLFYRHAVVEELVTDMADMAEPIPLAAFLSVESVEDVIVSRWPERNDAMSHGSSAEQRRLGKANLCVEAKDFAIPYQSSCFDDSSWSQEIEAAERVVFAEHAPRRLRRRVLAHRQLMKGRYLVHNSKSNTPL